MTLTDHRTVIGRRGWHPPDSDRRHDVALADPPSEDPFVSDWSDGSETAWAGEARRLERRHARALEERDLGRRDHWGRSA
jgi:hypothetical protein